MSTNIGIFFGSDTGNTENIAKIIHQKIGKNISKIHDIAKSSKKDIEAFNYLILGIPTWYYGEAQCDWDDFFPILEDINFQGKKVALFGCGDQEDYSEYFCDALGTLKNIIISKGANIIGYWPSNGYNFESSKALVDKDNFCGLIIDEDRQAELTNNRIDTWIKQIIKEFNLKIEYGS